MHRFKRSQWCDFVRGLAAPEDDKAMREHLAAGDSPDQRLVSMLSRVAAVGRAEYETTIPETAVRLAKVLASFGRPESTGREEAKRRSLKLLPFNITFDSLLQPALAGTRDLQMSHRQVHFKAEGYSVDVRLEDETPSPGTVLVGQILSTDSSAEADTSPLFESSAEEPAPVSRAPVFVFAGESIVADTLSGPYGEFQLEGLPQEPLDLCLVVGEDFLQLPLHSSIDPA